MDSLRVAAAGSIGLTGLALLGGSAVSYGTATPASGAVLVLVALGALLGLALAAGGGLLYRSDVNTRHTLRVAGWNLLGIAVLGLVLALARLAPDVALPGYVVVDVLGVSSVAHVLIGYNDVRRIRARDLARQREKLAVVNRLVRHNIRNETQILTGYASQLADRVDDPANEQLAKNVQDAVDDLAGLHEHLQEFQHAIDEAAASEAVDLRPVVEEALADYREASDGTFEMDVPDGLAVGADEQLRTALDHLVENAVTHADGEPWVRVEASERGGLVTLTVEDHSGGIPETDIRAVTDAGPESPLEHASGLGLWVVRAIVEGYGGDLDVENTQRGARVKMRFRAA